MGRVLLGYPTVLIALLAQQLGHQRRVPWVYLVRLAAMSAEVAWPAGRPEVVQVEGIATSFKRHHVVNFQTTRLTALLTPPAIAV